MSGSQGEDSPDAIGESYSGAGMSGLTVWTARQLSGCLRAMARAILNPLVDPLAYAISKVC